MLEPRREQVRRSLFAAAVVVLSWLAMQAVHEAGHVLAAWSTGGTVTAIVLHPARISRTDVSPNPHPLAVVWGGPVFGVVAPAAAWGIAARLRRPSAYLWRFFAGFCLITNGAYIGSGAFDPVGDAADLVRLGTPAWLLAVFGLAAVPAGLAAWHGQAAWFGFGREPKPLPAGVVPSVLSLLGALIAAELVWSACTGSR